MASTKSWPKFECADAPLPATLEVDWKAFFETEHLREPGRDVYQEIFDHGCLFPLQRSRETAAMMKLARSRQPRIVMEIGADKAGGFYHWIKCLPSVQKAIACEIRGTPYDELFIEGFPDKKLLFIPGPSRDTRTLHEVSEFLGTQFIDCLFIDGDKSYFREDFEAYVQFVRHGGLVFMHDVYSSPGVMPPPVHIFRELGKLYPTEMILDLSEGREAAERDLKREPITTAYDGFLRVWKDSSCGVGVIYV